VDENKNIPNFMSVNEAAQELRLTHQHVRNLLSQGNLVGRKISGAWVLDPVSVEKLAQARGSKVQEPPKPKTNENWRVLSFFSGAMGLDIGLELAGMNTILACESDKWSRETIKSNRPEIPVLGDIWNYDADAVRLAAGLNASDEIDVVAGGPPCQAFSTAGNRRGFEDKRGNVFLHFIDLALDLKPRYLVLENVRGLLSASLQHRPHVLRGGENPPLTEEELPGGALRYIIKKIKEAGYGVSFNLYNSANYGAPQIRERVVMICTRDGSTVPYLPPTHSSDPAFGLKPWVTFRDASSGLEESHSHSLKFPESRLKYFKLLTSGQYWKHLPNHLQKEALGNSYFSGGGKTGFLRRLDWDKPAPTLVTHPAMPATDLCHPVELRPLSIEEYKRIQAFPDEWDILGPLLQQYKQVGNAVPTPLGEAVGKQIIAHSKGMPGSPPIGFKLSRYKKTSDAEFLDVPEPLLW
jgi:DNA (cytosine-5)-methyltransferase 1